MNKQDSWLDTAVSGIKFGPDRRAVREELAAHIEDREADLRRIFPDIPPKEARDRALSGMGDAEEIGRALAKLHEPWLGYLWRLSQVVLAAALLLALISAMYDGHSLDGWITIFYQKDDAGKMVVASFCYPDDLAEMTALEPDREQKEIDGYTISMVQAAREENEDGTFAVLAVLRMSSYRFWALNGTTLLDMTCAVDSLGNHYASKQEDDWYNAAQRVYGEFWNRRPFYQEYRIGVAGVDPAAERLRLDYDWMGRSFSLTIDLKEAGI